jgi:hypothetical protein
MKIRLLLSLALVFTLSLCKKKETTNCNNGIKDGTETAIDCGGKCPQCPLLPRDSAVLDYNTNYLGSIFTDMGWNGSASNCTPGTVTAAAQAKFLQRLNYFRRAVGLNDNITFDASQSAKYQETALMILANGSTSTTPPSTWNCYTNNGADGASKSLQYLGTGNDAISTWMKDEGALNVNAVNRRWVLHSAKTQFAWGSTAGSMALGVIGVNSGNLKLPKFIAWPPEGFIMQSLLPTRWSFGYPGANFTSASVSMTGSSGTVNLSIKSSTMTGQGDNTIVWEPQGILNNQNTDVYYVVKISGIQGMMSTSYQYTVTIVKP